MTSCEDPASWPGAHAQDPDVRADAGGWISGTCLGGPCLSGPCLGGPGGQNPDRLRLAR
jgi:hypothetical protein